MHNAQLLHSAMPHHTIAFVEYRSGHTGQPISAPLSLSSFKMLPIELDALDGALSIQGGDDTIEQS